MSGGLHYVIDCPCGHAIELQIDKLGPEFVTRRVPDDFVPVALVCRHCKRVRKYGLGNKGTNHPGIRLEVLPHDSIWGNEGWLTCEDKACDTPLQLFAPIDIFLSPEERIQAARSWVWDGLMCPTGHIIPKP